MTTAAADVGHWSAHPWRARSLRVLVYAAPIACSVGVAQSAAALVRPPTNSLWVFLLWWAVISLAATVVGSGFYRLSSRLLPLGALLQLSLVFPDEAPSRFRLAMRTGTVEELEERLRLMGEARRAADPQAAAEVLLQLVAALDVHDHVTRGHAERVRAYAASLGKEIGLARDDLDRLNWAALLHDIGKLDVSAEILNKPGRPSEGEWEVLRNHPLYGEALVEPLRGWLGTWADAIGYHHEHWDGTGYPRAVAGAEIPLAGRIVAIADVYDVITSARSYKAPAPAGAAREELVRCSGTQFDPRLVRAFVNISLGRRRLVAGPISWLTNSAFLARVPVAPSLGAALGSAAVLTGVAAPGAVSAHGAAIAPTAPRVAVTRVAAPRPVRVDRLTPRRPQLHRRPRRPATNRPHDPALDPLPASPPSARRAPTRTRALPKAPPPLPPPPTAPAPSPAPTPSPAPLPPVLAPPPAPPLPNQAPSFTPGANQSALEDAGPQSVAGWASGVSPGPPAEAGQTVTFTVFTDTPGLFSSQPAIAADGTLTYGSAPDATGTATLTVVAHDDGGTANGGADASAPQSFVIAITPVNDVPTFVPGANQTAVSLLGAVSLTRWATAISPGPADEAAQMVTFSVGTDKPSLFSVQPAIAPDGTLTFRPKALALGTATISVRAVDNGGTANGGSDTSAVRTFTITVV